VLEEERRSGALHASEVTRVEVLAGMRPGEEEPTTLLLSTLVWQPLDAEVADLAGSSADDGSPATVASTPPTW